MEIYKEIILKILKYFNIKIINYASLYIIYKILELNYLLCKSSKFELIKALY